MWRQAEKLAPIFGEFCEGASLYQCTKPGAHEEALVQKERMNLRHSLWNIEEGKIMNISTPWRTTTESDWGKKCKNKVCVSLSHLAQLVLFI